MAVQLKFKRLSEFASPLLRAHPTDTGIDICAARDVRLHHCEAEKIQTDIALVIPQGYGVAIRPRSSMSARGILCALGTVDEGYRGEIKVTLCNLGYDTYVVQRGDRIAQLVLERREECEVVEVGEIDTDTDRGEGGFGSSGK